jgi:hypothetical protein
MFKEKVIERLSYTPDPLNWKPSYWKPLNIAYSVNSKDYSRLVVLHFFDELTLKRETERINYRMKGDDCDLDQPYSLQFFKSGYY